MAMKTSKMLTLGRIHGLLPKDNTPRETRDALNDGIMSDVEHQVRANASKIFTPKQPRGSKLCPCGRPISANKDRCSSCR